MFQVTIVSGNGSNTTPMDWTNTQTFSTLEEAQSFAANLAPNPTISVTISEVQ